MFKKLPLWLLIASLLVLYAVYTKQNRVVDSNSAKGPQVKSVAKDSAPIGTEDSALDGNTSDLVPSSEIDSDSQKEKTPAEDSSLAVAPKEDATKSAPMGKNELRYRLHGSYVIAGEDLLLGEIKPEDKAKWSSSGRIPWSREVEIWHGGVVPIALHSSLPDVIAMNIKEAIAGFHQQTSIRFVEFQDEKDAVLFVHDPEVCASHVGRVGGHQPILLSERCGVKEITHELMHTLGFIHEHQRENRDSFVNVHLDQVREDKMINFDILPSAYQKIYRRLSVDFDPKSITLYPPQAFSKTGEGITISSKNSTQSIQPSHSLSPGDLNKIKEVYERGL